MAYSAKESNNQFRETAIENQYCVVRWSDDGSLEVIHLNDVKASLKSIKLFKQYPIRTNEGRERKGTVISKGTKKECELLYSNVTPKTLTAEEGRCRTTVTDDSENTTDDDTDESESSGKHSDRKGTASERTDKNAEIMNMLKSLFKAINVASAGGDNAELHRTSCDGCRSPQIRGDRYRCLQCENFDLCSRCFEHRAEPKEHKSGHLIVHFRLPDELFGRNVNANDITLAKLKQIFAKEVNDSIFCDGCKASDFTGLRFKCDSCADYDLCEKCATDGVATDDHKSSHPLILTSRRVIEQISVNDIELAEKLGSGAFGSVHKARWISKNRTVACKVIKVSQSDEMNALEKSFFKELLAYMELSGRYILKTYGYAMSQKNNEKTYMIISEYMARGSLSNVLKEKGTISLRRKVNMARQIASGVRRIHEHGMLHRDIRPDNILVNQEYTCKIADMGIARRVDPMNQHTQIGCQPFMPPEFREGTYNQKLDIFTFGLTLNELFTETKHSFRCLAKEKIVFEAASPVFQELINRCTANDPKYRPRAMEIEKTFELYDQAFDEIVLKKHPGYMNFPTSQKDEIYMKFYEKFHKPAMKFIQKQFPSYVVDESTPVAGVRVKQDTDDEPQIRCRVQ